MFYYNQNNFDNEQYNYPNGTKTTIKKGGCGLCSTLNAINNLAGKELYTVPQIRDLAQKCGARVNGGTDVDKLLKEIEKAHKEFSHKSSCKNAELVEHLQNGGLAILHQGKTFDVFSSEGHYVCAYGIENNDNIKVLDSCYTTSRYKGATRKSRIIREIEGKGVVVDIKNVGKATNDPARQPAYYLISIKKKEEKPKTEPKKESVKKLTYKTTIGQEYKLKKKCKLYEKANHKGKTYNYLANTTITVLKHIDTKQDQVKVKLTGRVAICDVENFV